MMREPDAWNAFGSLAFTDSGGSDKYERAFGAVMEWLRVDSQGAWREWFDNDRYGDLGVILMFRRTTLHPRTRVSVGDGFVDATRNVPTESYFGLSEEAMLMHVCEHIGAAFAAVSRKLNLAEPPMDGPQLYAALGRPVE